MAASAKRCAPIRDAIRLRYRLLPYLYTLYRDAAMRGAPILRPLFYDFDDDPRAFDDSDDFMVGPNLLVASVVEPGQRRRRVYLPSGPPGWIDFWTGARHDAGREIEVDAPLERIPLFVPDGAMIPADRLRSTSRVCTTSRRGNCASFRHAAPARARSRCTRTTDSASVTAKANLPKSTSSFARRAARSRSMRARVAVFALPYTRISIVIPDDERRRLVLRGEGITLAPASPRITR